MGGKDHLEKRVENGVEKPASTYTHDVDFKVAPVCVRRTGRPGSFAFPFPFTVDLGPAQLGNQDRRPSDPE
jgi:hypothetical protein